MKYTKARSIELEEVISITCDICQRNYESPLEIQAFVLIDKTGGYGSAFGDGTRIKCDLCQYCLIEKLGGYLQMEEQPIRA